MWGNIRSQIVKGFVCENGPNTVLMNNPAIVELITELGLVQEICRPSKCSSKPLCIAPRQASTNPYHPLVFVRSPLLNWKEKLAVLQDFYVAKHTADSSIAVFCKNRLGMLFTNSSLFLL